MSIPLFRGRAFVAALMAAGFLVLAVSGAVLYAAPRGWAAQALDWRFLALDKREWQNLHIVFGLLFLIAGAFHLWLNRKPLFNYIRQRLRSAETGVVRHRFRIEPLAALLLVLFLFAAAVIPLPPASTFLDIREAVVDFWLPEGMTGPGQGQGRGGMNR